MAPSLEPFAHTLGPQDASIVIVGEAWGEQEEKLERPFIGQSGQELTRMLREAGIDRSKCLLTNVLALRPPNNNLDLLCVKRKDLPEGYTLPPLRKGNYLDPQYTPQLARLRQELISAPRTLAIALGASAAWALVGNSGIGSIRGTVAGSTLVPGLKVLPTYHPAGVLRNWAWRPIVVADLLKAQREAQFPELRRPERWVTVNPSLGEIQAWIRAHAESAPSLAVDIETAKGQITCIGFASGPRYALVVPFWGPRSGNYWQTLEDELAAWAFVRQLLELPCPKIFQNGIYDLTYILRMGFRPANCLHDTMLHHHALYPELQKGLGFLGSIYTNEASWKLMRLKSDMIKRDE